MRVFTSALYCDLRHAKQSAKLRGETSKKYTTWKRKKGKYISFIFHHCQHSDQATNVTNSVHLQVGTCKHAKRTREVFQ